MIKRAVVPIHSKSVKRRYPGHGENQFLDFDLKTRLLLPFLLLEACGLRLVAPREGSRKASAHLLSFSWSLTPTPTSWQRGRIGQENRGTVLLWSLALCILTIADACRSPFPRFPSLRSAVLQPPLAAFPHGPAAGIPTLLVGPLV